MAYTAKELKRSGYRVTSRKSGIASRVDRPDWEQFCKDNGHPVDADWYRRCLSKDNIYVGSAVARKLGTSCHDKTGYVEKIV